MIIATAKLIKDTIEGGGYVYRKDVCPVRVIDVKTIKGQVRVKLMHRSGKTEWVNHYSGDTYSQY